MKKSMMRRNFWILLAAPLLLTSMTCFAQTAEKPVGLYRLQKFIFQDGRTQTPAFSQYKYAADSAGLLIFYRPSPNATQWSAMSVEIREPYPLTATGEQPQGADGHGTQIYNVDEHQFYFKWYNDRWTNISPLGQFVAEVYAKEGIEKETAHAFSLLENKATSKAGKFAGWWVRTGAAANPDGSGTRQPLPVVWKAYGDELSMVTEVANNADALQCLLTSNVKIENDTTILELGHQCDIHWLSDDCHTLTYVQENGVPLTEIWERSGLPEKWQKVFGTDIAIYLDANTCIGNAVYLAANGDLQQAKAFIAEAVSSKGVHIEPLCAGSASIVGDLYNEKKQYKECIDFSEHILKVIDDYVQAGHEHNAGSSMSVNIIKAYRAAAIYRSGEKDHGKELLEGCVSAVETEIEKYRNMRGMENYVFGLYFCNLLTYGIGYDIFGTERTLLFLDALPLMAPPVAAQLKPIILDCRGRCYLLDGNKDSAQKVWKELKDNYPDYLKEKTADNPLIQAFGR